MRERIRGRMKDSREKKEQKGDKTDRKEGEGEGEGEARTVQCIMFSVCSGVAEWEGDACGVALLTSICECLRAC